MLDNEHLFLFFVISCRLIKVGARNELSPVKNRWVSRLKEKSYSIVVVIVTNLFR